MCVCQAKYREHVGCMSRLVPVDVACRRERACVCVRERERERKRERGKKKIGEKGSCVCVNMLAV